ncbi:MAG: TetR/AcrR family transcriptional regulator [Rhizobiaceae bacterium]
MDNPKPRKLPLQTRSGETVYAIIEATARILESEGCDGLTTNHIAERAGVSIGSLYQYFPNKQAILAELLRKERSILLEDVKQVASNAEGMDINSVVKSFVKASLDHQFSRAKLAFELEHIEPSLPLKDEVAALSSQVISEVAGVIRDRGFAVPEEKAQDIVAMCKGMINSAALAGERDAGAISLRVEKAVLGYLE